MVSKIIKNKELGESVGERKSIMPTVSAESGLVRKRDIAANDKSAQVIAEAQIEAQKIRRDAGALLEQVHEELEKARQKGLAEGREIAKAELTGAIAEVKAIKTKFFEEAEPQVVKLVLSIAEKVIGKLVSENDKAIRAIVKESLEHALGDRIIVKVHPEDLTRLKDQDLEFKDILDRTRQIHFKEDAAVQKGGCIVETEIGTIDAQLETQMKAIRKAFGV